MQKNILWQGVEYHSLEHCIIVETEEGYKVDSTIIGHYEGLIYKTTYKIRIGADWTTRSFELSSLHGNKRWSLMGARRPSGSWAINSELLNSYENCYDIDISLTPFTNTLPINRLQLSPQQTQQVNVLHIDVLSNSHKRAVQQYSCRKPMEYKFENVPNDFEAVLTVDEYGFVEKYPQLFDRLMILDSQYPV